jgi:hypothetical protein
MKHLQPKTIDPVETSKRRVALHLLKVPSLELSNAVIAHALGWTVDQLLNFYRQDKPPLAAVVNDAAR